MVVGIFNSYSSSFEYSNSLNKRDNVNALVALILLDVFRVYEFIDFTVPIIFFRT